jgi:hypothetical protein
MVKVFEDAAQTSGENPDLKGAGADAVGVAVPMGH